MSNYTEFCARFTQLTFPLPAIAPGLLTPPPYNEAAVSKLLKSLPPNFPARYATAYGTPVATGIGNIVSKINQKYVDEQALDPRGAASMAELRLNSFVGAIVDWNYQGTTLRDLKAFKTLTDSIFGSFSFVKEHFPQTRARRPPAPLTMFAPNSGWGFTTINPQHAQEYTDLEIAVVSLPFSFHGMPLLWGPLAHEVGGHDVIHTVPSLIKELKEGVSTLSELDAGWDDIWVAWMEEAAADVFATLILGPVFAVALAARLASADGRLATTFTLENGLPTGEHPVELLRLYVLKGAIGCLEQIGNARRQYWKGELERIIRIATGSAKDITANIAPGTADYAIKKLAAQAEAVGRFILNTKLQCLENRSVRDIKDWTADDETAVEELVNSLNAETTPPSVGLPYLLAASILAAYRTPASFDKLNCQLREMLWAKGDEAYPSAS
jgi:hypothetical protein